MMYTLDFERYQLVFVVLQYYNSNYTYDSTMIRDNIIQIDAWQCLKDQSDVFSSSRPHCVQYRLLS